MRDGIYVPIVLFSLITAIQWVTHWLLPGRHSASARSLTHTLLGLGSMTGMIAHALENSVFGLGNWLNSFVVVNEMHWLVNIGKVLILASVVFTGSAFHPKITSWRGVGMAAVGVVLVWVVSALVAVEVQRVR